MGARPRRTTALAPAWDELLRQAAQGEVLYTRRYGDEGPALSAVQGRAAAADEETDARTGVFTSGLVATRDGHRIALFFTGHQHAGENLADVLAQRAAELPPPIHMCDALATNTAGDFDTLLANCLAHARRRFVDVVANFPAEVRHVLETLRAVYQHDALAREHALSPDERLRFHQAESGPLMAGLAKWLREQLDAHRAEPNSGLGEAIAYMRKHWAQLTLFLRVPGAPLDNNLFERALKKAILHRKNALFYKTLTGARVGDVFMSLIHTAELNRIAPFDYLVALLRHLRKSRSPGRLDARGTTRRRWRSSRRGGTSALSRAGRLGHRARHDRRPHRQVKPARAWVGRQGLRRRGDESPDARPRLTDAPVRPAGGSAHACRKDTPYSNIMILRSA